MNVARGVISPSTHLPEPAAERQFERFRSTMGEYIVGSSPLASVRDGIAGWVGDSHERAVAMLRYVEAARANDLIPRTAALQLMSDIELAVTTADKRRAVPRHAPAAARRIGTGVVLNGRYELRERVGKGGIGEVYRAIDRHRCDAGHRQSSVAIKIIQKRYSRCKEAIRSLQREAVNAQCLVHPNVRRVFGIDRDADRLFLAMEWLAGETLGTRLDRTAGQPMGMAAFQALFNGVAAGLSAAHANGIVHGDVKPGNVFVTKEGGIKLLDFGHTDSQMRAGWDPSAGPFALTRGYASVQVHRGALPEIADDVYSLAAMAYRMLAGRRPHGRLSAVEAAEAGRIPTRIGGLSRSQWAVLLAALSADPRLRPESIGALRAALMPSDPQGRTVGRLVAA